MKTEKIIIGAFVICTSLIAAQTGAKKATVRIKTVETINGTEKVTDSTFTTDNPQEIELDKGKVTIKDVKDENGMIKRIVMVNDNMDESSISVTELKEEKNGRIVIESNTTNDGKPLHKMVMLETEFGGKIPDQTMVINVGSKMSPEQEKNFKARTKIIKEVNGVITTKDSSYTSNNLNTTMIDLEGMDSKGTIGNKEILKTIETTDKTGQTFIIKKVGCGASKEEVENAPIAYQIKIIKRIDVVEMDQSDKIILGKSTSLGDDKLNADNMKFYPNPNNGKFNLSFSLKEKGTTDVTILNMEGKSIYSEKLKDFTGTYDKEIDISKNPKGVYFVRIEQGAHSQLKKIIME
jgi:hypothetical protein